MKSISILNQWLQAVNQADVEKLVSLYDKNAILIPTFSNKIIGNINVNTNTLNFLKMFYSFFNFIQQLRHYIYNVLKKIVMIIFSKMLFLFTNLSSQPFDALKCFKTLYSLLAFYFTSFNGTRHFLV